MFCLTCKHVYHVCLASAEARGGLGILELASGQLGGGCGYWDQTLTRVTDFPCSYLRLQGSHLSACLNLHLPKAHTSSTKSASLWSHSSPFICTFISCAFLDMIHVIRSQVIILSFPEFTGVLPTRQEYRVSLTQKGQDSNVRLSVCLQQNTMPAPQGSHSASPLINVLFAICQPESRNLRK